MGPLRKSVGNGMPCGDSAGTGSGASSSGPTGIALIFSLPPIKFQGPGRGSRSSATLTTTVAHSDHGCDTTPIDMSNAEI
jgi:hypothetical protein